MRPGAAALVPRGVCGSHPWRTLGDAAGYGRCSSCRVGADFSFPGFSSPQCRWGFQWWCLRVPLQRELFVGFCLFFLPSPLCCLLLISQLCKTKYTGSLMILVVLIIFPLLEHLSLPSTSHMCLLTKQDNGFWVKEYNLLQYGSLVIVLGVTVMIMIVHCKVPSRSDWNQIPPGDLAVSIEPDGWREVPFKKMPSLQRSWLFYTNICFFCNLPC